MVWRGWLRPRLPFERSIRVPVEPQSGIEQIGIGMHASDTTLNIEVPAEGQRKPAETVAVMRFKRSQISVGAALK